jgi:hypothetical protein
MPPRVGRLAAGAGRRRPRRRGPRRRDVGRRRRPRARVGNRLGRVHRRPAAAPQRPRPGRRHRRAARRRRARRAAGGRARRGRAARAVGVRAGARGARAGMAGDGPGLLAVRVGAGARAGRGGRCVRQPGAACGRAHRSRGVPRRLRPGAGDRRRRDPRRHRGRRRSVPAATDAHGAFTTSRSGDGRGRSRRSGHRPGEWPPTRCRRRHPPRAGRQARPCRWRPNPGTPRSPAHRHGEGRRRA